MIGRWALLRYYLQQVGLRHTVRMVRVDLAEQVVTRIAKRFPSVPVSPRSVQIECTTRCNLKCTFCELSYWNETPTDITLDTVRTMIEHLPRLERINLTGIGEPLMNRDFFPIVELLASRGIHVGINSNFTMMTEKAARRIVELGIDHVLLSLDAASKQTYEQIRVNASFDKVVANAKRLLAIRRELGKQLPEVRVNTVVCSSHYRELPAIVELAHEIGIARVVFGKVLTFDHRTALGTEDIRSEVVAKLDEASRRGRELGVLVEYELFEKLPVQQCDLPWKRSFVTHTGHVHPCCYTSQRGDRQAQNARSLGNLLQHSFAEIWRAPVYTAFRRKMKQGTLPHECQGCPMFVGTPDVIRPEGRLSSASLLRRPSSTA